MIELQSTERKSLKALQQYQWETHYKDIQLYWAGLITMTQLSDRWQKLFIETQPKTLLELLKYDD